MAFLPNARLRFEQNPQLDAAVNAGAHVVRVPFNVRRDLQQFFRFNFSPALVQAVVPVHFQFVADQRQP